MVQSTAGIASLVGIGSAEAAIVPMVNSHYLMRLILTQSADDGLDRTGPAWNNILVLFARLSNFPDHDTQPFMQ